MNEFIEKFDGMFLLILKYGVNNKLESFIRVRGIFKEIIIYLCGILFFIILDYRR